MPTTAVRPIDHLFAALDALWDAFNAAYDRYPGDPLHPERVAARAALWAAQHPEWIDPPLIMETPF